MNRRFERIAYYVAIAAEVTKAEWQKALKYDEDMLAKYEDDLEKIQNGEEVENLTEANAKKAIDGLKKVIQNKKNMLRRMASERVAKNENVRENDWVHVLNGQHHVQGKVGQVVRVERRQFGDALVVWVPGVYESGWVVEWQKVDAPVDSVVAAEEGTPHGDQFVGNPETHGIDEPRGGGFSIMQELVKDLHNEQKREAVDLTASRRCRKATGEMGKFDIEPGGEDYEWAQMIERAAKEIQRLTKGKIRFQEMRPFDKYQGPYARMNIGKLWSGENEGEFFFEYHFGPEKGMSGTTDELAEGVLRAMMPKRGSDYSGLKSRRAMYWGAPDRTYRLTRQEQENGSAMCPKCRKDMEVQPFTKRDKLYVCPACGFKVPKSKTVTNISIEVKDGEVTDVDVTTAKGRRGKMF